jgi:branched-chain amino acid transport system permease protein
LPAIALALPLVLIPTSPVQPQLTWLASNQALSLATFAALFAIVAYGLGILMRFADLPSIAHAALWGVGAYTAALAATELGLGFWPGIALAATVSGAVALAVGLLALRARGMTFLILTLAIADLLVLVGFNWKPLTNGSLGLIVGDPSDPLPGVDLGERIDTYYVAIACLYLTLGGVWLLSRSRFGGVLEGIRDNEELARALGVNVTAYQLVLFCAAGAVVGAAGQLYLAHIKAITPDLFNSLAFIPIFLMVVMGGVRSLAGPALGAWLVVFLPEWLQPIGLDDPVGQQLMFGVLLVAVILLAPNGIAGPIGAGVRRLLSQVGLETKTRSPLVGARRRVETGSSGSTRGAQARAAHGVSTATNRRNGNKPLLELTEARKQFGGLRALDGVSFDIRGGEILGLIGPNGSGKTTVVNCLSGFNSLGNGEICWRGSRLSRVRPDLMVRLGLVRTFQDPRIFESFTVWDHCELASKLARRREGRDQSLEAASELLHYWGLDALADAQASALSNGQRRNLSIAAAMATEPELLLLDEPAAGLTDHERDALRTRLDGLRRDGVSLMIIDHTMSFLMPLSDRVVVLDAGRKIAEGTPAEIQRNAEVASAYLGKRFVDAMNGAASETGSHG